ncbi:hypothetical protein ACIHFD_10890 [Nonomuraea sp. NPDC051941]|uniref:preprotein translocase subunit SecA n=1 Tax=Nonomuraea sp. NPDC051941 TaxID=3364373 RepID=UPI0037C5AE15
MSSAQPRKRHAGAIEESGQRLAALADTELAGRTQGLRERRAAGESLDELLADAFALAREASWRAEGYRPSENELEAAAAVHHGSMAEVKGRAAAAAVVTLAAYLGALDGRGVHVISGNGAPHTVAVCRFLGLEVECLDGLELDARQAAYAADVTVGSVGEFSGDHLRDNLCTEPGEQVQRDPHRAIVIDADRVLLDSGLDERSLEVEGERVAFITVGEYLRLYAHLSGVTATAATDADEFAHLYGLPVEVVPAAAPAGRRDHPDLMFADMFAKYEALVEAVAGYYDAGRPVIIVAGSGVTAALLADGLTRRDLAPGLMPPQRPLGRAGRRGAITLLTEPVPDIEVILGGDLDWLAEERVLASGMDPVLSANDAWAEAVAAARQELLPRWRRDRENVIKLGGLVVLGAERLAPRRLELRLRELAGEYGETQMYVSMDDDLVRLRVPTRAKKNRAPIRGWLIARAFESRRKTAEREVAARRRRGFAYAAVYAEHRAAYYAQRRDVLTDPLAAVLAVAGPDHEPLLRAMGTDLVRGGALGSFDEQWFRYLESLRVLYEGQRDEGFPEHELASYRERVEVRFQMMRRDLATTIAERLSSFDPEQPTG